MRRFLLSLLVSLSLVTVAFTTGACDPLESSSGDDFVPMVDPNDDDFNLPSPPPDTGLMTWLIRAQQYTNTAEPPASPKWEPIGGLANVHIDATPLNPDPKIVGGVGGSRIGPFPYDKTSVYLPFQFPFYIAPGITVNVTASITAILMVGEKLDCWVVGPGVQEVAGTRSSKGAIDSNQAVTVDCHANLV